VPDVPWTAVPFVPASKSLPTLERAVQTCKGCPLFTDTTQAVFGAGPSSAPIVLVGEQPGDQEDKQGRPFVGPAGRVLWSCVEAAGIDRDLIYATNAVKHFKHEQRGKRRIHKKPNTDEIEACHPWIDAELRALDAAVIVALGATAARSLFGRTMHIAASREAALTVADVPAVVTYHPSAVLRADEAAEQIRAALIDDLRRARKLARHES
jgi:uracil-DNA glycosylase family protein